MFLQNSLTKIENFNIILYDMNYVELDIPVTDENLAEILTAELTELPFESFSAEKKMLKAYITQDALADCKYEADEVLASYGIEGFRYVQIESQNWNALWESNFEEVNIDNRIVIRAPFHAPHPELGDMDIVITPRMAFGTGHHSTTALMVQAIADADVEGKRILDMGSGTGVLAIVALKRGAASADAVDIDDAACDSCRENFLQNGITEGTEVLLGDVRCVAGRKYDLILANINRNILLRDMEAYASMLDTGGRLFVSGFLEQDTDAICECAAANRLQTDRIRTKDGWVMAEFSIRN